MNRRSFVKSSAGLAAFAAFSHPPMFDTRGAIPFSPADLPKSIYPERLKRAQEMMESTRLDLLFATPGSNFLYMTGYNPGRSERLIALLLPRTGNPVIVAPSFERERIRQRSVVTDIAVWEEQENPFSLSASVAGRLGAATGKVGIEPTTNYSDFLRLAASLPGSTLVDGGAVFDELRMAKNPEELDATRKAIDITLASIAATHAQLKEGLSEAEVAEILSSEMRKRGSRGDGLVQFGPDSALPHGGPGDHQLKAPCVVLIDAGCRVDGYISDISRTIYWGGESSAKFKQVFNVVLDAQQTAASIARSGVVCEEMDRAARNVIRKAGFGNYFTHRLGHGIGLDGHEYPYLVEGNGYKMKENQTFTIEPGIYLPGEFGVRIEDDFVITGNGVSQLSPRVDPL